MAVSIEEFNEIEHISYIQAWEEKKELYTYLSHTRPKYLRENDHRAKDATFLYMIKLSDKYIGAAWIEDITDEDAKLGIYIAEPEYRGRGIGEKVIRQLINKAFGELNLRRIYLNVRSNNERAIKCYKKCGFEVTQEYSDILFANGTVGGVYRMTLSNLKY